MRVNFSSLSRPSPSNRISTLWIYLFNFSNPQPTHCMDMETWRLQRLPQLEPRNALRGIRALMESRRPRIDSQPKHVFLWTSAQLVTCLLSKHRSPNVPGPYMLRTLSHRSCLVWSFPSLICWTLCVMTKRIMLRSMINSTILRNVLLHASDPREAQSGRTRCVEECWHMYIVHHPKWTRILE